MVSDTLDCGESTNGLVSEYETSVTNLVAAKRPGRRRSLDAAAAALLTKSLLIRDELARVFQKNPSKVGEVQERVIAADETLRGELRNAGSLSGSPVEAARALINPPKHHWWWHPQKSNPLCTILALFLLTLSLSFLADFTRRLLNSDPGQLGILAIAFQALLAVGASSTFTRGGRDWLRHRLPRLTRGARRQDAMKLFASVMLLGFAWLVWAVAPKGLAVYYSNEGFHLMHPSQPGSTPQLDAALRLYTRALSLDPELIETHVNLGVLYEDRYEYDKAAAEYRIALTLDSGHVKAYSDLGRLYLIQAAPTSALRVIDEAFANQPTSVDSHVKASMYRNRASAEYELGFLNQAEGDAAMSIDIDGSTALSYCVLAKVYRGLGKGDLARQSWKAFSVHSRPQSRRTSDISPPSEPDCTRLAEEAAHEND